MNGFCKLLLVQRAALSCGQSSMGKYVVAGVAVLCWALHAWYEHRCMRKHLCVTCMLLCAVCCACCGSTLALSTVLQPTER